MRWSANAVARATGGRIEWRGRTDGDAERPLIDAVSIDSRRVAPGALFVALVAERDGHDFVPAAVAAGAAAVLVGRGRQVDVPSAGRSVAVVSVDDTGRALLDLGGAARSRIDGPVAAITGSVGKTSTKDLAAAALASELRTVASERSFNNELGMPLTLANAAEDTEVAVLEMGARGPGHIRLLCRYGRPTIGVVTAVAAAHTDAFGDLDGVAEAKGELVEALPADGYAVLNVDDPRVAAMAVRTRASIVGYSVRSPDADVAADNVLVDDHLRASFTLRSPWGCPDVQLEARGVHQVGNALAALAVAGICGVDMDAAAASLRRAVLSPWRMEVSRSTSGAVVVNDAYNANPASMTAALEALASLPARRHLAVLGLMAELGPNAAAEHAGVAAAAARLGVDVVAIGTDWYGIDPVATIDGALERLGAVGQGDAVLVKASRVAGLEQLAARLLST